MSNAYRSCQACSHYKTMGEKVFCFKKSKVMTTPPPYCEDFKPKAAPDKKRRRILEERDDRKGGSEAENIELIEKPMDTEGFKLPKKSMTKDGISIDTEVGEGMNAQNREDELDQGQKLFLAILVGGMLILIAVLFATGVF